MSPSLASWFSPGKSEAGSEPCAGRVLKVPRIQLSSKLTTNTHCTETYRWSFLKVPVLDGENSGYARLTY